MTSYKDFDAAVAEAAGEPITFKLGGQTHTIPRPVPAFALIGLTARLLRAGGDGPIASAISQFTASSVGARHSRDLRPRRR